MAVQATSGSAMPESELKVRIARSMAEIDPAGWDACANPVDDLREAIAPDQHRERFNPFLTHAFLNSLETSGSATSRTGWSPVHIVVEDEAGATVGCAPCYLKTHSMGEYVFDYAWADAFERAGGNYYPKLQVCVPFTPVQGRRLLVAPGPRAETVMAALVAGLRAVRSQTSASSIHITFPVKSEWDALGGKSFLKRTGKQFHFFNSNYGCFDDFLADLSSRKRKNIRKEREAALTNGIEIEQVTGSAITEAHWDAFFSFYMDTGARKWGRPYLTRRYYSQVGAAMADRILLVMAKRAGRYIAGAINFIGDDALYGRNWGAIEEHPFLHFEACYYQAIDFAIARKLSRVEAGAQGEHKLARGYGPVETYSLHEFADARLSRAVDEFLRQERLSISESIELYGEHVPFRRDLAREVD
jgi:predicted N-acyltransferase